MISSLATNEFPTLVQVFRFVEDSNWYFKPSTTDCVTFTLLVAMLTDGAKGGEAMVTTGGIVYPEPGLVMVNPVTVPFVTIAIASAPKPIPVMTIAGGIV